MDVSRSLIYIRRQPTGEIITAEKKREADGGIWRRVARPAAAARSAQHQRASMSESWPKEGIKASPREGLLGARDEVLKSIVARID